MWKKDLSGILSRLDRLETAQDSPEALDRVGGALASAQEEIEALSESQESIETKFKHLLQAVADGIERVDRSERRVIATIKRARKELAEHGLESAGLEAEDHDLRLVDGVGGEERGVPPVRDEVAEAQNQASSIRGVSVEQLRRAHGL